MNDQKTITIKEALGFPEGTPIPRIVGKLTHIFDRKSGEGKHGAYTSQSGVISDGENKILFTVWNKPEFPQDYKGQTIIFRAGTGKKPTMTLKSDFKDASKRTLNVTASCFVLTENEETDDIPYDAPPVPKVYENAPKANVTPMRPDLDEALSNFHKGLGVKSDPKKDIQDVKRSVMQMANLREICDHAAQFLYPDGEKDFVKEIGTSLFIQATRDGLHKKLPGNKPLSKKEDVEASEPDLENDDVPY